MKQKLLSILLLGWVSLVAMPCSSLASELETRVFRVTAGFLSFLHGSDQPSDPFAEALNDRPRHHTVQSYFKDQGVEFGEGSAMIYSSEVGNLVVRNKASELDKVEKILEAIHLQETPRVLHILVEFIEVEGALYHDWMYENRITGTGTPLRKQVQAWVKEGKATILESPMIPVRSGQRAKTESIEELIYPTEPGVPEIPNVVTLEGVESSPSMAGAAASAFEVRNVGSTFEVDPVLGVDNVTIDLNLAPEVVRRNGLSHWPPEEAEENQTISMPRFYKMKITTQITTLHGEYGFLGTCRPLEPAVESRENPIVLVFTRSDVGRVGPAPDSSTPKENE